MSYEEKKNLLVQAEAEMEKGNYSEAERICNEVLEKFEESSHLSPTSQGNEAKIYPLSEKLTVGNFVNQAILRARTLVLLSESFLWRGMSKEALPHAKNAIAFAAYSESKKEEAKALNIIGMVYSNLSDYSKALEYLQKGLAINEELGAKNFVASALGNIGIVYAQLSDCAKALEYYQKALVIAEEIGAKHIVATSLSNIGIAYKDLSDYAKALEYYQKALAIAEEIGTKKIVANNIGNIGGVYKDLSDYAKALEYYQKALVIAEEIGSKNIVAASLGNIGALYATKDFNAYNAEKAEEYLLRAVAIGEEIGYKNYVYSVYKSIADLYKIQERWKECQVYFEKYHNLREEIQGEETKKQAERFSIERNVAVIQREQEVLLVKNAELAELNSKLEEKNAQLVRVNSEKNVFLGIASHDLKNPLNAITMLSTILFDEADTLKIDEVREYSDDIRTSSKQMFDLIINLLDYNKIERGTTLSDAELFSVKECTHSIVERYFMQALNKNIQIIEFLEDVQIQTSKSTLIQILENLISNAIKFSPFDKNIFVRAESNDQNVRISIQDEGPGLTDEDKSKLFGQFTRLSAKPTGGEHSTGLGLSIVKRMVEMMNGKIWCESEAGKGATFIVELPIAE